MPLNITDEQRTTIIEPIDTELQSAFDGGVASPGDATTLPRMTMYEDMTEAISPTDPRTGQQATKDIFRSLVAAMLTAMGIKRPFAAGAFVTGQTVTIGYRKADGVTIGSLTFTDGILTDNT